MPKSCSPGLLPLSFGCTPVESHSASFSAAVSAAITFCPATAPPAGIATATITALRVCQIRWSAGSLNERPAATAPVAPQWHHLQHLTRPLLATPRKPRRLLAFPARVPRRDPAILVFCHDALFQPTRTMFKERCMKFPASECGDFRRVPHYRMSSFVNAETWFRSLFCRAFLRRCHVVGPVT